MRGWRELHVGRSREKGRRREGLRYRECVGGVNILGTPGG